MQDIDWEQVRTFASDWLDPEDISCVMDLDYDEVKEWMKDKKSKFAQNYKAGKLMRKVKLHRAINKLSEFGSSPAQTMAKKLLDEQTYKELMK